VNAIDSGVVEIAGERLVTYRQYTDGEWKNISGELPEEMMLSLFVNDRELVSILCTPEKLNCLVLGYLRSEGFISSPDEIAMMRICADDALADVKLKHPLADPSPRRVLTSGCGRGVSFDLGKDVRPVSSGWTVSPGQILAALRALQRETNNGHGTGHRGVHVSALSDGENILVRAEDIGRHNTLDKIWGECMLRRVPTEDSLLLTTGRISSEMLGKAARMGVPVVASMNSATRRAIALGERLGITVVGYARGGHLSVFTGEERLSARPNGEYPTNGRI